MTKKCSKCGEEKPLDGFHRDATRPDGRKGDCKECRTEYMRSLRASRTRKRVAMQRAMLESSTTKTCIKCQRELPHSDFWGNTKTRDGLRGSCKACANASKRAYYRKNKDKVRDYYLKYGREYQARPHVIERRKRYEKEHPDRILAAVAKSTKRQRAIHPEKRRAQTAVGNAVRDGRLKKAPCVVCGGEKVQGHHWDYGRPLDVLWLCVRHHRMIHNRWVRDADEREYLGVQLAKLLMDGEH